MGTSVRGINLRTRSCNLHGSLAQGLGGRRRGWLYEPGMSHYDALSNPKQGGKGLG